MSSDPATDGMVLRAKIVSAKVAGRTLVQATTLDEDARDNVELLLPPGYVASPVPGADTIELQIGGFASHKVHIGGDYTGDSLADLQPGESGLSHDGQQVILRITGTELITPLLQWGPTRAAIKRLVQEEFVALFNEHRHEGVQSGSGLSGVPSTPMTADHLTGGA